MNNNLPKPEYVFETSWEICNKIGGINTVVATKALMLVEEFKNKFITIGPDLWREAGENPVFIPDNNLFADWQKKAYSEGLRIKVGRWDIVGKPISILVDFSGFVSKKNDILKTFWETYKLDSISGGRDYIESTVFGYVAGKVVESFCRYYLAVSDNVVAHFHEWMTGAGVLYLKKFAPQIATTFTTHATTVGRSIAGNGFELYGKLHEYNGDSMAKELGVVAKQSMEKIAANQADSFTTVSEITASECAQFLEKKVDVVTPNGFEDNFVPQGEEFDKKRDLARQRMKEVTEALLGYELSENPLFVANSGRYEYTNKGIDIFIHSLAELNRNKDLNKEVVAFILVPANNYGPKKDLQEKLQTKNKDIQIEKRYLTHGLHDSEWDPILNDIKKNEITNNKDQKVKVVYAPCYLDGKDGIFNLDYYDLLIGMDLTVFPSYYEPWGYTPLESLAFHIPTITTKLAGIGMWVNSELVSVNEGIEVFERKAGLDPQLVKQIVDKILSVSHKSYYDTQRARENAFSISRIALWKNLIKYYHEAFGIALQKAKQREGQVAAVQTEAFIPKPHVKTNEPIWKNVMVQYNLPEIFKGLEELARNIWWSWNFEATDLFESIAPELWEKVNKNPIRLLKEVSYEKLQKLQKDRIFFAKYNAVYEQFRAYMEDAKDEKLGQIAYFSMEYGLTNILKIYSGGLGILAGDYLKEASDSKYDMSAVGFLYKYGYFTQQLSLNGEQLHHYEAQNFTDLPLTLMTDKNGNNVIIEVAFPGRVVHARVWKVAVGRINLYLLDTDFDMNNDEDKGITHQLYGGDNEHRLKQEILLGVGGIRALRKLGIYSEVYHCNEGHAAFIGLERLREYINNENLTFAESLEIVRGSTLFTTHTPVPAGHDAFTEDKLMVYMGHYPERLKLTWDEFMDLGRMNPGDAYEKFSMSHLAASLSQEINGVSMLHGEVTKRMFKNLWRGFFEEELHIGYVTNGIHAPSWIAQEWKDIYREIDPDFFCKQENRELWSKIYKISDEKIWNTKEKLRKDLIDHIKDRLDSDWVKRHENPKQIVAVKDKIDDKCLTIGFARRFATYKRAHLLFRNIDRLAKIVNNPEQPVQFLFAGKAHPHDGGGQGLIKMITEISKRPEFIGKIIFLENYDIELAKKLVHGVDIWLNTPTRPLEASGTSGMKAIMNGVLNFSVLDGWWVEGYKENAGWALPLEKTYPNQDFQDDLDAETIYAMLENEIVPMYYKRNDDNIPVEWIDFVKNNIANICPDFTTKRMIDHYQERFYGKLKIRHAQLINNDYKAAKQIASWKKRVYRNWDDIQVVEQTIENKDKGQWMLGEKYPCKVVLDLGNLADIEIGIELLITETINNAVKVIKKEEMKLIKKEATMAHYEIDIVPSRSGIFNYGLRVFAKNELLPHRQDFSYLKWI